MHEIELQWMQAIAERRTPWLNTFFIFMRHFDAPIFLIILIPMIWYGINRRWGIHLFYATMLSGILNMILKEIFELPRPLILEPSLGLISINSPYGFPSGAAQMSILIPGLLLAVYRTSFAWVVAITFGLLLSTSRIYLGVHFPTDILGGWVAGAWLLYCYLKGAPLVERWMVTQPARIRLTLAILSPLLLALCIHEPKANGIIAVMIGTGMGICLAPWPDHFQPSWKWFLIAVLIIVGILNITEYVPNLLASLGLSELQAKIISNFAVGLWQSLGFLAFLPIMMERKSGHSNPTL